MAGIWSLSLILGFCYLEFLTSFHASHIIISIVSINMRVCCTSYHQTCVYLLHLCLLYINRPDIDTISHGGSASYMKVFGKYTLRQGER